MNELKRLSFFKQLLLIWIAVILMTLSGCGSTVNNSLRMMGQSHQCEREAANRPNGAQLLAECQNRFELTGPNHDLDQ